MNWISVLDKLPPNSNPVLVATNISVKMVQDAQKDQHGWYEDGIEEGWDPQPKIDMYFSSDWSKKKEGEWAGISISDFSGFGIKVTHWMPLPKWPS